MVMIYQMSFVINIKFWAWSKKLEKNAEKRGKDMPYEMIAAMPAPHGVAKGSVDALAISPDGNRACTLSKEEGAFHIWAKGRSSGLNKGTTVLLPSLPSWKRLCKITIPAGYLNACDTGSDQNNNLVPFSPDGSVVAIAFGRHVTLLDHTTATILIQAPEPLKNIQFVRSPIDMVLATGETSVSVLPPCGNGYLGSHMVVQVAERSWAQRKHEAWTGHSPRCTERTCCCCDSQGAQWFHFYKSYSC
jgi:hypothetical protein